jgi:uncharacterized cupin superfamily protein
MNDRSEAFPSFQHEGTEFIYMLHGKIAYRHGRNTYRLEPGDSLTFAADVLHGPEHLIEVPIRFLSIICTSTATLRNYSDRTFLTVPLTAVAHTFRSNLRYACGEISIATLSLLAEDGCEERNFEN